MVTDNPDQNRYEVHVDGELAGFLEYRKFPGRIALVHTEVRLEGRGIGSELAKFALEHTPDLEVTAICPFVRKFVERHPEYRVTVQ